MNLGVLAKKKIHITGIKGSGCTALVQFLIEGQCEVTGSDSCEQYHTCSTLNSLGIKYYESFSEDHVQKDLDFLIHSPAYSKENPEITRAKELNISILTYPEALGLLSKDSFSIAIAGVHGKTTISALCAYIAQSLNDTHQLGINVLTGSTLSFLDNRAALISPGNYFIAETCEYRRHFLHFHPDIIVLTSIELDHHDYFLSLQDITEAFLEFCQKLPSQGILIFSQDDPEVAHLIKHLQSLRTDLHFIPYGECAEQSDWQILCHDLDTGTKLQPPYQRFKVKGLYNPITLHIPGIHSIKNATAALALFSILMKKQFPSLNQNSWIPDIIKKLINFSGVRRRSEIVGQTREILIMDDYAHHPTAIHTTLEGFTNFYKPQRLIVSFMSHTYSRTAACLYEFAHSLSYANILFLHKIFASTRESSDHILSRNNLYKECKKYYPDRPLYYFEDPLDALPTLKKILKPGDLFVTLGAGNNFHLAHTLYQDLCHISESE